MCFLPTPHLQSAAASSCDDSKEENALGGGENKGESLGKEESQPSI